MLHLLLILLPLASADSMMYLHPANPQLHPGSMYPMQKPTKAFTKVRDLPQSGIIYLKRIKPIEEEFAAKKAARDDETFVAQPQVAPLQELKFGSSNEANKEAKKAKEAKEAKEAKIIASLISAEQSFKRPVVKKIKVSAEAENIMEAKIMDKSVEKKSTKIVADPIVPPQPKKNEDLSAESLQNLDKLLMEVGKYEDDKKPSFKSIQLDESDLFVDQKSGDGSKPKPQPKLVTLTASTKLHSGAYSGRVVARRDKAKLVTLRGVKRPNMVGRSATVRRDAADFDPWERIGQ